MGTVKAFVGYGIGLAVVTVLVSYVIRGYRRAASDYEHKLARRDARLLQRRTTADYAETFLGAPAPARPWGASTPTNAALIGPEYDTAEHSHRLRLLDGPVNMN